MRGLPYCTTQNPACGACGLDTTLDDDRFICDECGLNYGAGDGYGRAEFLNEEAQVCGAACSNDWHGDGKIRREWSYNCHPCRLPEGHTSDHWTDCDLVVAA